jgi:hypothetical protein
MAIPISPQPDRQTLDEPWSADGEAADSTERGDPAVIPYHPPQIPPPAAECSTGPPDDRPQRGAKGEARPTQASGDGMILMGLTYEFPEG